MDIIEFLEKESVEVLNIEVWGMFNDNEDWEYMAQFEAIEGEPIKHTVYIVTEDPLSVTITEELIFRIQTNEWEEEYHEILMGQPCIHDYTIDHKRIDRPYVYRIGWNVCYCH